MFRVIALNLAVVCSLTLLTDAASSTDSERKGEIELLSYNNGVQAGSSKPKEIVVVPSKRTQGVERNAKPNSTQPRKLGTKKGGRRVLLPAVQMVREPAGRLNTQ